MFLLITDVPLDDYPLARASFVQSEPEQVISYREEHTNQLWIPADRAISQAVPYPLHKDVRMSDRQWLFETTLSFTDQLRKVPSLLSEGRTLL